MWVDQESQLYILCPSVAITDTVQDIMTDQQQMYENMYLVTKEEFESCSLDDHRGTLAASSVTFFFSVISSIRGPNEYRECLAEARYS